MDPTMKPILQMREQTQRPLACLQDELSPASGQTALSKRKQGNFCFIPPFPPSMTIFSPGCLITTVLSKTGSVSSTKAATFPAISSPHTLHLRQLPPVIIASFSSKTAVTNTNHF